MDILRDTKIDFMKYRKFWITFSLALVAVGVFTIFFHGNLNVGIDFAGGTQLTVEFADPPQIDELRSLVAQAGFADAQIQRYGEESEHQVILRTAAVEGSQEGSREALIKALGARYGGGGSGVDLNSVGAGDLAAVLTQIDPDRQGAGTEEASAHYRGVAEAILEARREAGLIASWDALSGAPGVSPAVIEALKANATIGRFAVLGVENVGPQIGEELRTKGVLAVVLSLLGMLVYIWIRFELHFGIGAVMASLHDVLVTLGLFMLFGFEFNLTTIAAFLTLVGYGVNDTVVVFDRVRENRAKSPRAGLLELLNVSLNQTLSRTILTSGTVLLSVVSLLVLGGEVLRGFAFVMTVGVIVGTYSTIYIAGPFALLWEQTFGIGKKREAANAQAGRGRPAAGVPPSTPPGVKRRPTKGAA